MFNVLENYFSSVLFVPENVRKACRGAVVANREGNVSLALIVSDSAVESLFTAFSVPITDKLKHTFDVGTALWLVDLDSLLTDKIRFYSYAGLEAELNLPEKEFNHPVDRTGIGLEYDVNKDEYTMFKKYYQFNRFVDGNNREYVHYKYTPDNKETGPFIEYGSTISAGKHFKDTIGIRAAMVNEDVTVYSTYRIDANQTYLHILPK